MIPLDERLAVMETANAVTAVKISNIEADIHEIKAGIGKLAGGGSVMQKALVGTLIVQSILSGVLDPVAAKVALKTILGSLGN